LADHPLALIIALALAPALGCAASTSAPAKHLGVSTCSSAVCHGSVTSSRDGVQLNEYLTWAHRDAHSRAYAVLHSARSRQMAARLGFGDAAGERICLDCHADNVPSELRGEQFRLADGIGCEACHGGAERWLTSHSARKATYRDNLARGMYPTADLGMRAELCLSCHYGTDQKFASHRLMAAGHPRLSFEMGTFLSLQPPHYRVDESYRRRKPSYGGTQAWAHGQIVAARKELEALAGPMVHNGAAFPELALFNCYGCHTSSMHRTDWSNRILGAAAQPGSVPVSDGYLSMAWMIARQLDPAGASTLLKACQDLIAASAAGRDEIVSASRRLMPLVTHLSELAASHRWSREEERDLLAKVLSVGADGGYRDYIDAEQAVMGIDGLMIELGISGRHRAGIDLLYRLVQNDDAYDADKLAGALRQLQKELGR
jgi:hypothetical protein